MSDKRSSNPTSRSLIALVRERDPAACDRLVALYAPLVFHSCRRARLTEDDAADVFQEVFQATYAKIERFVPRLARDHHAEQDHRSASAPGEGAAGRRRNGDPGSAAEHERAG